MKYTERDAFDRVMNLRVGSLVPERITLPYLITLKAGLMDFMGVLEMMISIKEEEEKE